MKPIFIVGAPRSGTTMLRDLFKQLPDFYSPEETHFYRWAAPFRGNEYNFIYKNNGILRKHREMDGVSEDEFWGLIEMCYTRREFNDAYCDLVAKKKGAKYWIEKTPQNIFGLPLLLEQYSDAAIVHIVRHPYDVVKSLLVGKVLKVDDVVGAANYWVESVSIFNKLKPLFSEQSIEVKYEDLTMTPIEVMRKIENSLGIKLTSIDTNELSLKTSVYDEYYTSEQMSTINKICSKYMKIYGYELL